MKIAFLNIYGGINQRGAESFSHELANRLSENHEVVFFQAGQKTSEEHITVNRIESPAVQPQSSFPARFPDNLLKRLFLDEANRAIFSFTRKVIPRLTRESFEVVIPMNGFWQLFLLMLCPPFGNYKILTTGHSGPGWDERFNLYLHPNVFVATTMPAYEWAKSTCPWTRVELIPYAIDDRPYKAAKPETLPLSKPIILCPAALVPYKRIELAIEAVSGLKDASLLVLGQGPLEDKLLALGRKKLGKRFLLTSVSHNRMPSFYAACDLVTLPSDPQENSPMVFLESLAAGKLVVTTDTPRNRWMLEGAGVFCDPTVSLAYRNALSRTLGSENEEKTKAAIGSAFSKFRWTKVKQAYQRILTSLEDGK